MTDPENQKELRRKKITDTYKKEKISEEQRFVSKSKKQFKKQKQDIRADELWEDWENEIH